MAKRKAQNETQNALADRLEARRQKFLSAQSILYWEKVAAAPDIVLAVLADHWPKAIKQMEAETEKGGFYTVIEICDERLRPLEGLENKCLTETARKFLEEKGEARMGQKVEIKEIQDNSFGFRVNWG